MTIRFDDFIARPGEENASASPAALAEETSEAPDGNTPQNDVGAAVANAATPPPPRREARLTPGEPIIIDSLVGQIHGRAIFANEFFAPLDAMLRTQREQRTSLQFEAILEEAIDRRLRELLENELLLAQAQLRLTPEQQMGLFAWIDEQQKKLAAERGGTRATAERHIAEEFGADVTFDDLLDERRKAALLQWIYEQEIEPRIIVWWKDIEDAYEQNYERFNEPAEVKIARLWLDATDQARIDAVTTRLAAGDEFMKVFEEMSDVGTITTYTVPSGGDLGAISDLREDFRKHLAGLEVGDTTDAFTYELSAGQSKVVWLHVLEVNQPPGRSIYDPQVQMALRNVITQQRRLIEEARYFNEQLGENILADLDDLRVRLIDIGRQRYK